MEERGSARGRRPADGSRDSVSQIDLGRFFEDHRAGRRRAGGGDAVGEPAVIIFFSVDELLFVIHRVGSDLFHEYVFFCQLEFSA